MIVDCCLCPRHRCRRRCLHRHRSGAPWQHGGGGGCRGHSRCRRAADALPAAAAVAAAAAAAAAAASSARSPPPLPSGVPAIPFAGVVAGVVTAIVATIVAAIVPIVHIAHIITHIVACRRPPSTPTVVAQVIAHRNCRRSPTQPSGMSRR